MTFDDFKSATESWFQNRYNVGSAKLIIEQQANDKAQVTVAVMGRDGSLQLGERAPFWVDYSTDDALQNARICIQTKMLSRDERLGELLEADIDDPESGGMIDGFYTDFVVTEGDRIYLERFLQSSDLETRKEALIALMFGVKKDTGPKFGGYAMDALVLHFLGAIEDSDSQFTGHSVLSLLRHRGDEQARAILKLLENNPTWRKKFFLGKKDA
jgi:hypothetical protein